MSASHPITDVCGRGQLGTKRMILITSIVHRYVYVHGPRGIVVRKFLIAASCLVSSNSPAAVADQPLIPTGKWVVDFADHQCVASRQYGTSADPITLAFKPSPVGDIMQIAIVKNSTFFSPPLESDATIQVDEGAPFQASLLAIDGKTTHLRSIRTNLSLANFAPMRRASSVSIRSGKLVSQRFGLSQMSELMKAMDACVADLKAYWNIDDAAKARLKSRAKKGDLRSLFSSDDYPNVALSSGEDGTVGLAMLINEKGKVADCTVTKTSGVASLDAQSCAVLVGRAQYVPAVGADGKPAKDADFTRIHWMSGE